MDATSHNIVASCLGFLANKVVSDCMGLNVCPVSNYTQQVPTLLWFHRCKRTQHVGPNNVACCWPTMLRPFARELLSNEDEERQRERYKNNRRNNRIQ